MLNLSVYIVLPLDQISVYHSLQAIGVQIDHFLLDTLFLTEIFIKAIQRALYLGFIVQKKNIDVYVELLSCNDAGVRMFPQLFVCNLLDLPFDVQLANCELFINDLVDELLKIHPLLPLFE